MLAIVISLILWAVTLERMAVHATRVYFIDDKSRVKGWKPSAYDRACFVASLLWVSIHHKGSRFWSIRKDYIEVHRQLAESYGRTS